MKKLILATFTALAVSSAFAGPKEDYQAAYRRAGVETVKNTLRDALTNAGRPNAGSFQFEIAVLDQGRVTAFASNAFEACRISGELEVIQLTVKCFSR